MQYFVWVSPVLAVLYNAAIIKHAILSLQDRHVKTTFSFYLYFIPPGYGTQQLNARFLNADSHLMFRKDRVKVFRNHSPFRQLFLYPSSI